MKLRLVFWPVALAYLCFLIVGNATLVPVAFSGALFGAVLGVGCAWVFFRRARRHHERELARLLARY